MKICRKCQSLIEAAESNCCACGAAAVAVEAAPAAAPLLCDLEESYSQCLERGKAALESGNWEEAASCLREAAKRSRILENAESKEIQARKLLGEALERQAKIPEAADQYRIISQLTTDSLLRELWLKKSQDLVASSNLSFDLLFKKEDFRPLLADEIRHVPLYCSGCKRLLSEAEVYGFRRGVADTVRCWCGIFDRPLAKSDSHHPRTLDDFRSGQRARAIDVASRELPGAKKQSTACLLALFFGWCGAHRFYLGDNTVGMLYLFFSFTVVPLLLGIYEALVLWHMSLVSFNMTYNLDLVLKEISPAENERAMTLDVFSLSDSE